MKARAGYLDDQGFTLVELMVVLAVIAVLMIAGAFQYQGWVGRYRVESEVKQMYSDLMNARAMALARSRMFFINMPASDNMRYQVFEDTNGGINGDGALTSADEKVTDEKTSYVLSPSQNPLSVNSKGLITNGTDILVEPENIRFMTDSSLEPDYDCIELTATRINMGLWNGTSCAEK